jgi:hypothetical protein
MAVIRPQAGMNWAMVEWDYGAKAWKWIVYDGHNNKMLCTGFIHSERPTCHRWLRDSVRARAHMAGFEIDYFR